jgi:hypothetical protein
MTQGSASDSELCAALPDETHQIDIWAHCASAGQEREIHIPDAVCPG